MGYIRQEGNALLWQQDCELMRIEPWGPCALRTRVTVNAEIDDHQPHALLTCQPEPAEIHITPGRATIRNGNLIAEITADGQATYREAATGRELLSEVRGRQDYLRARNFVSRGGNLHRAEVSFRAYDGERCYGLGQHQHGRLDQKGCVIDLAQANSEVTIPFLLSSRGYGFLWNNPAIGRVELGFNQTRWVAEATGQMDWWVTTAGTPAEILSHYADVTGHAPLLPDWATGFWQCKLRYRTQEELLAVAREYKRRGIPLSVIVVDFFHWTAHGDWRFDERAWPDPTAMVRELADMGVRLMVSVWPTVNINSRNLAEMLARDLLVRTERGVPVVQPHVDNHTPLRTHLYLYDATNPAARRFLWEQVREGYYRHGIRVWWLDACEPEINPAHHDNLRYHAGNGLAVGNIYPQAHAQGFYEHMRSEGEEEVVLLCRSAWAGSQRYGAAVWSGDIPSSFEALQNQVRAGLNMACSGIPWWTTDIGGFVGGDGESPSFRELLVRWFQYGAFCPLFRLHGFREPCDRWWETGGPNEIWSFGPEVYAILREYILLRERLRPYMQAQMRLAHEQGLPPMRPLFVEFPADERCYAVDDQFMLGAELLVAPILHAGARERTVCLPSGASWRDAWSGEEHAGGQVLSVTAPLEHIPLFLRNGVQLPIRET